MTPFEAHILIQQNTPSSTQALEGSLKSTRLNPNAYFNQESLLATAIKRKAPELLKLLLQHGATPDLKSYENGRYEPALITAVRIKSQASVKTLVECGGANIYKTNFYGSDAIFQAVHENAFDILDYLLQHQQPRLPSYYHSRQLYYASPPTLCSSCSNSVKPIVFERASTSSKTAALASMHMEEERSNRRHDDGNWDRGSESDDVDDDHDHVLCPFYYALKHASAFSCKLESLVQLLQSYYRCKCLEEIASCCESSIQNQLLARNRVVVVEKKPFPPNYSYSDGESSLDEDAVRECLAWLGSSSPSNILKSGDAGTHNNLVRGSGSINTSSRPPPATGRNGKYIKLAMAVDEEGGSGNENENELIFYPYKIYRVEGKCHAIKENESSSSLSLSSGATGRGRGPSLSYVVLVGPLKLACITKEVIRYQIMFCSSSMPGISHRPSSSVEVEPSPVTNSRFASVASSENKNLEAGGKVQQQLFPSPSPSRQRLRRSGKRNFRKSLEALMIPPSLKLYLLYRQPNGRNERNAIHLIRKDLVKNINYFAIYI